MAEINNQRVDSSTYAGVVGGTDNGTSENQKPRL